MSTSVSVCRVFYRVMNVIDSFFGGGVPYQNSYSVNVLSAIVHTGVVNPYDNGARRPKTQQEPQITSMHLS